MAPSQLSASHFQRKEDMNAVPTLRAEDEHPAHHHPPRAPLPCFIQSQGGSLWNQYPQAISWPFSQGVLSPFPQWLLTDAAHLHSHVWATRARTISYGPLIALPLFLPLRKAHGTVNDWECYYYTNNLTSALTSFLSKSTWVNLDTLLEETSYLWTTLQLAMTHQHVYFESVIEEKSLILMDLQWNYPAFLRTFIHYLLIGLMFFDSLHKHLLCNMLRIHNDQDRKPFPAKKLTSAKGS